MKIGIFQDIHANLPAFKKAMEVFRENKCSKIYHIGDLIGIGPHPREVFKLANSINNLELIMGNHDYWFAYGLPNPISTWMNEEEVKHHKWQHKQIGEEKRPIAQKWKFIKELELSNNRSITFLHYGIDPKTNSFKDILNTPNPKELDKLFSGINSDIIFYGHNHKPSDIVGRCRYVNLGSAGCYDKAEVRLGILEVNKEQIDLKTYSVTYKDNGIMEDFEERKVPDSAFIKKTFITRSNDDMLKIDETVDDSNLASILESNRYYNKQLKSLAIRNRQISDISFLKDLKYLRYLDLSSNEISDISFLKEFKQLIHLDLSDNQISDISFLKDLKQLKFLNLRSNRISDISSLKELKQVSFLDLSSNVISDINVLKELNKLSLLYLDNNKISNIPGFIFYSNHWKDFVNNIKVGNPIINPPLEIIEQDLEVIFDWFFKIEETD